MTKDYERHDGWGTELYSRWTGMKARCYNKRYHWQKKYEDRGITVCPEWRHSFNAFREWALTHGFASNLTLERKDNSKGYSPGNCIWTTHKANCDNRSNGVRITAFGETKSLREWAKDPRCKATYSALRNRIYQFGVPPEQIITRPSGRWVK
jgi:hypothetical protein